jgi:hypothetical protein
MKVRECTPKIVASFSAPFLLKIIVAFILRDEVGDRGLPQFFLKRQIQHRDNLLV